MRSDVELVPKTADDLTFASIAETGGRIRDGLLSPVALAQHCLDRIALSNPTLNAFITVTTDLALQQARRAEEELRRGHWRGPLHGIPVAVKDFYDTAGIRTTAAFEHFQDRMPGKDAVMVTQLREAGAVLLGKTNMHTLGKGTTSLDSHFGPVVNPWSEQHVAGGSSGGSAVAVAAGLCFATIDTDAIGSGRLPAAICGVTCLKPTFGVLSGEGILAGEETDPAILVLSHPCVTARSVDDVALAFAAVSATPAPEASTIRRIGVVTNFAGKEQIAEAFVAFVSGIEAMGIATRQIEVPFEKASFDLKNVDKDRSAIDASLFGDVDVIVLPTLAAPTPTVEDARRRGDLAVSADNTFFCNYFGLPAVSVPSGHDKNGLPLGVQFVGPHSSDASVLALASAYQLSTGWRAGVR